MRSAGAALAAACAPAVPPPRVERPPDIELKAETVTIEARVPQHATLDSLLREQQLAAPFVTAAIEAARSVFDPRQLRSDRPYRLVRSLDGLLREFEYQIDADRFLRIIVAPIATSRAVLDAEVVPYEKQTARRRDARPDRRRSSVGDRGDGRNRRDDPAGDVARRDLQRRD